ncbi:MAG: hypothetical protein RI826_08175, partial [Chlorobium phaeovibrioides]|nr:hypothetical protein [Chlorobium phaeovibrioides]
DGLGTLSYQWYAGDDAISEATASTYTLTQDEVGKVITVEVSYTDGEGTAESVTSAATAAVANVNDDPIGSVTISGSVKQNETVTAVTSALVDDDGVGAFSYQWYADGEAIEGATASSQLLTESEVDAVMRVEVSYTDGYGAEEAVMSTATATVANVNDNPVGDVNITGLLRQGKVLAADGSGITDADGLGAFSYQWYADGSAISNATASTYTLTQAEVGKAITVSLSYTDAHSTPETIISTPTAAIKPPGSIVSGTVTFWQTGAAINALDARLESAGNGAGTDAIMFRNMQKQADGSHTVDIWLDASEATESVQFAVTYTEGSTATWQDAAGLPNGWSTIPNTENSGMAEIAGMGVTAIAAGESMLGTLTISAGTDPDNFILSLEKGEIGEEEVQPQRILSTHVGASENGLFSFPVVEDGTYALSAGKEIDGSLSKAVKATDALAALKIAVGINPNSDGSEVLPYQYLAADVNHDGKVKATDALAILKMAVHLDTAPEHEWLFVPDSIEDVTMDKSAVDWEAAQMSVTVASDIEVDLVGIVKGDVNGSWVADAA